jgi:hypothetical protein
MRWVRTILRTVTAEYMLLFTPMWRVWWAGADMERVLRVFWHLGVSWHLWNILIWHVQFWSFGPAWAIRFLVMLRASILVMWWWAMVRFTIMRTVVRAIMRTVVGTIMRTIVGTIMRTIVGTIMRTIVGTIVRAIIRTVVGTVVRTIVRAMVGWGRTVVRWTMVWWAMVRRWEVTDWKTMRTAPWRWVGVAVVAMRRVWLRAVVLGVITMSPIWWSMTPVWLLVWMAVLEPVNCLLCLIHDGLGETLDAVTLSKVHFNVVGHGSDCMLLLANLPFELPHLVLEEF